MKESVKRAFVEEFLSLYFVQDFHYPWHITSYQEDHIDFVLAYFIPMYLREFPSFWESLFDFDKLQAYLYKRKYESLGFSAYLNSSELHLMEVASPSLEIFEIREPGDTCPIIDRVREDLKRNYEWEIDDLRERIESLEKEIFEDEEESESNQVEIDELKEKIEDLQDMANDQDSRLDEDLRLACENTRSIGRENRSNFFSYWEDIQVSNGVFYLSEDRYSYFKDESYSKSDNFTDDVFSEPRENLELIEKWAAQWTDFSYIENFFEYNHFEYRKMCFDDIKKDKSLFFKLLETIREQFNYRNLKSNLFNYLLE